MKRKIVLFLVLLLSSLSIIFIASVIMGCESIYDPDFFGMHESLAYRSLSPENLNISRAFEIMHSLGVRKLRMSFWRGSFMLNSTEIKPNVTDVIERVIQKAHSLDMEIMCYAQDFPIWMRIVDGDGQTVPRRNMTEGSTYRMFLEVYEESWETLARTFPNITMWEIGNEFNMDAFLHPLGFNETIPDSPRFSVQERADITTDLLYYGSLGVHEGNPKAKTVLGGLAPHPSTADFLDRIYKNIKSGRWPSIDPDDYFQIACWHLTSPTRSQQSPIG